MRADGPLTFFVLRPLSDLFLWAWRLERRVEFLYRPQFDRWIRPGLFALLQGWQNVLRRHDDVPALAEETQLPQEEQ